MEHNKSVIYRDKDLHSASPSPCAMAGDNGGSLPAHSYTREELVDLSELPLSKKRPDELNPDFHNCDGVWDPEIWMRSFGDPHRDHKSYPDGENESVRRPAADRSSQRDERDSIVLGPQRKSFGTGCHVTTTQVSTGGQKSTRDSHGDDADPVEREPEPRRERDMTFRRIGSGRLTVDRDKFDDLVKAVDRSNSDHERRNGRRDDWRRVEHDRAPERDRDRDRDRWEIQDRNPRERVSRHERYRRRSNNSGTEYEPEWFTAGPTTQSDTIELRGFNDPSPEEAETPSPEDTNMEPHADKNIKDESPVVVSAESPDIPQNAPVDSPKPSSHIINDSVFMNSPGSEQHIVPGLEFDINELFSRDTIPTIPGLENQTGEREEAPQSGGSRFSQWFTTPQASVAHQHTTASGSLTSQVNMDYDPIEELLSARSQVSPTYPDGRGPVQPLVHGPFPGVGQVPGVGLAPSMGSGQGPNPNMMNWNQSMANVSQHDAMSPAQTSSMAKNRFRTVQELESTLSSPTMENEAQAPFHPGQSTGDMSAFNKLVGMMQLCGALPQEQSRESQVQKLFMRQNPTIVTKPASPMLNPMLGEDPSKMHGQPPPPMVNLVSPNAHQRFAGPGGPAGPVGPGGPGGPGSPFINIAQMVNRPRAPSPIMFGQQPPTHLNAPSPVHPNPHSGSQSPSGVPFTPGSSNSLQVNSGSRSPSLARVPSPQELVFHTQAIMQNALIKKQLEEQKERFNKKQQGERPVSSAEFGGHIVVPQPMMASNLAPNMNRSGSSSPMPPMMSQMQALPPELYAAATEPSNSLMSNDPAISGMQQSPSFPITRSMTAFTPTSVIKKMAVVRSNTQKDRTDSNTVTSKPASHQPIQPVLLPPKPPFINLPSRQNPDPSRIMAVPPMPQQSDIQMHRALIGRSNVKSMSQMAHAMSQAQGPPMPSPQAMAHAQGQGMSAAQFMSQAKSMVQSQGMSMQDPNVRTRLLPGLQQSPYPGGRPVMNTMPTSMPTAFPRMSGPPPSDFNEQQHQQYQAATAKSLMGGHGRINAGSPGQYNMSPHNSITTNRAPMSMPGGINNTPMMQVHPLGQTFDLHNMNRGHDMHPGQGPPPSMSSMAPDMPRMPMGMPMDTSLAKWFGSDMLKQQLDMPPLPTTGQNVLTVDEIERRQQVVN